MIIHEKVADEFVEKLLAKTKAWKYGDPMDPRTDMGTVIDEAAVRYCEDAVNEAVGDGAKLLRGHERQGALYSPTVLDQLRYKTRLVHMETVGSVSPVVRFKDINAAIR